MADNNHLRCCNCNQVKPRAQYSNAELEQFDQRLRRNRGGDVVGPRCQRCCQGRDQHGGRNNNNTAGTRNSTTTNNKPKINDNVVRGDHIKCGPCGKYKDRLQYSNKQLQDWESRKRYSRGSVEGPKCRSCTGQPQTEWECSQCEKVLPKDKFAKSQRNKKEHALCMDCSQERQDREPNIQDAEEEEKILEEMQNQAGGPDSAWSTHRLRSTLPSFANSSMPSSHSRADDGVFIPGTALQVSRSTARVSEPDSDTATQMGSSSVVSRSTAGWGSVRPIEQTHRGPRASGQSAVAGDRFAKQGAVKKTAGERAQARYNRTNQGNQAKQSQKEASEDESGSGDADRDDDDDDDDDWVL